MAFKVLECLPVGRASVAGLDVLWRFPVYLSTRAASGVVVGGWVPLLSFAFLVIAIMLILPKMCTHNREKYKSNNLL